MGIRDNVRGAAENALKVLVPKHFTNLESADMGAKDDNSRTPREGERDVVPPEDASARDSLVGDAANQIDPDMGTAEAGASPVEPKSQE